MSSVRTAVPTVTGHLDALDGVRAVAAIAVLVFHVAIESAAALQDNFFSSLLARGDVAVPVFFALSGLLLYRPYARAALRGDPAPSARVYLLKRALRILPAYWLVVIAAMALWSGSHLGDVKTWLELLLLAQNYDVHPWWYGLGPRGLAQMWSLCVEVAFYLVLPLLAAALTAYARRGGTDPGRRARRLLTGVGVLAASSFAWALFTYYPVYRPYLNTWLPRASVFFAVGMALAVVSVWAREEPDEDGPPRRFVRAVGASTGSILLVGGLAYAVAASPLTGTRFSGVDGVWADLSELLLYAVVAACLVAPAALMSDGRSPLARFLGGRVMRFLGRVSYGIFLWQFVALYLWYDFTEQKPWTGNFAGNLVVVGGLTLLLATLTYKYVEEPARGLARFVSPRRKPDGTASPSPSASPQASPQASPPPSLPASGTATGTATGSAPATRSATARE
ncbi:acyltransferase family protein [Microbispora sp. ATCC PTA-5024]|uniref:acyltransferase family protein n=1 Tax=Microbispora sp. ATCC PTA-5024 TaxID=316330 RepID=UPI0003DC1CC7|nr:acyltransferase [Microbispora sp. ATCC PTA-5024]ETK33619.1 acyltransferase [Microbispora sp. ATCC PTA-5024]